MNKQPWKDKELIQSSYISENKYRFLNLEGDVGSWNDTDKSKLWLYNLHYFDDINAIGSSNRRDICVSLINSWIQENPPLFGNGWEPYPLSLRIVNWIKFFHKHGYNVDNSRQSLYLQAHVLRQNLEYHLLGNHLFANAKALVFAGCYFKGEPADEWLKKGLEIIDTEVSEQILHDGGNFELSPMYHNIILADMLDLYNLANTYDIQEFETRKIQWALVINKMLDYSESLQHPDGEVSFFNDSAIGIAATYQSLSQYAAVLGIPYVISDKSKVGDAITYRHYQDTGYIVAQSENYKAILDVARIGPDYIPGHAHADTLSFELSIFGQRVFVNTGTGEYGLSQERLRQRKTAAHNTVEVDGLDSSEVWSGFRVAKRAYPSVTSIEESSTGLCISCSHDGYMRLKGKVIHHREWLFESNQIDIVDSLSGTYKQANAYLHLHPNIQAFVDGKIVKLVLGCGKEVIMESSSPIKVENAIWCPEFGKMVPTIKFCIPVFKSRLTVSLRF
ncbi:heparinase II/III family protein [Vibrio sp. Isolate23]|uniref:heparinase II/III family protein n=1 Tax=Vibrio sp. Isolate23 TaxID=2908533 RepID=UPI001EFE3684|nr:heparinase II/III family protein [Vibrio sp. Isolate23]MCG9683942.1 heparinase II/III family protein [Vibrio sp. Isolate23]